MAVLDRQRYRVEHIAIEVSAVEGKNVATELHIQKHAIGAQVPKGTLKSL